VDWLPKHKCGLYLEHNAHRDSYEDVDVYYDSASWVSGEELQKAMDEDSAWFLVWYPETPCGSHRLCASSLEALEAAVKEMGL
jgi:hypothetical protein